MRTMTDVQEKYQDSSPLPYERSRQIKDLVSPGKKITKSQYLYHTDDNNLYANAGINNLVSINSNVGEFGDWIVYFNHILNNKHLFIYTRQ